jgi:hypothetical protein
MDGWMARDAVPSKDGLATEISKFVWSIYSFCTNIHYSTLAESSKKYGVLGERSDWTVLGLFQFLNYAKVYQSR